MVMVRKLKKFALSKFPDAGIVEAFTMTEATKYYRTLGFTRRDCENYMFEAREYAKSYKCL